MTDIVTGYLVLVVPRGETHLAVFSKKTLYVTWDSAVARAGELATLDSSPVCLLRSSTKTDCARWQNVKVYELSDGAAVYIQAVFTSHTG